MARSSDINAHRKPDRLLTDHMGPLSFSFRLLSSRKKDDPSTGRVERRRDRFRPMASCVFARSSMVANGPQVLPTFPPPSLIIPYRACLPRPFPFRRRQGFSQYGWKPAWSFCALAPPSTAAFDAEPAVTSVCGQCPGVLNRGCTHRPLAQHGLS